MGKCEMVRLGDVCELTNGYAFESAYFSNNGKGMPIIRIRDVVRGFTETYTTEPYKEEYVIKKGDLLIGMDGEFNIAPWNSDDALLNQRVCKIESSSRKVLNSYLLYYLPKALKAIEEATSFVTVKHLSSKKINEIEVPLPPLEVQRHIVDVLHHTGILIEKRKAQIEKFDLLIKSQFIEMFGDPVNNQMGWPLYSIDDLTDSIETGESLNGEARPRHAGEKAVLKVSAVTYGYFKPDECKVLLNQQEIKKNVTPLKGDLLFSRANTRELVGATVIVDKDYPDLILPDKLWKLNLNKLVVTEYMKQALSAKSTREYFSDQATGTSGSMFNVSMDKLKRLKITLPPLMLQNQFADFIQQTDKSKFALQQSLLTLELTYKSLMQKCFRCEIF
ncbi:restriction endonuclease subunit S [Desulfitobacterium sp. THU1]|uniref:restriction endonuclease subunit S n=1 Tax=Desulfitobacterium sp. THU1 TaxID=3138072 RepID=UPI0031200E57